MARSLRGASLLRLRIAFILIAMVVSVFAARLFQLQGVDAKAYVAKARAEGVVTLTLPATRGRITDRNGEPLAESVDGMMLVADPVVTAKNASAIATVVARRLDVDYFDVLTRLTQARHAFPVPRPAGPLDPGARRRRHVGGARHQGRRHPARPGP